MRHSTTPPALVLAACLALLGGCATVTEIRVENASPFDFEQVSVAGEPFGDIPAGATSEYRKVRLRFRYALVRLTADGVPVNAQTLNFGSKRYTHRIKVKDLAAGHLGVDILPD